MVYHPLKFLCPKPVVLTMGMCPLLLSTAVFHCYFRLCFPQPFPFRCSPSLPLAVVMSAAVAMLLVQVLVVATVGFDGGSRYDVVVLMMESWLVGAWVGPQFVGLGGCAPTVRESVGLQSAAGAQGCAHQHNRHRQHHQYQHHHHRTSRRLREFSVPLNSGVNSLCAARRRRMRGRPGTGEVFLFVFPVNQFFRQVFFQFLCQSASSWLSKTPRPVVAMNQASYERHLESSICLFPFRCLFVFSTRDFLVFVLVSPIGGTILCNLFQSKLLFRSCD